MKWKTAAELLNAMLNIPDIAQRNKFLQDEVEKYGRKVVDLLMNEQERKGQKRLKVSELLSIPEVAKTQAAVRQEIEDRFEKNRILAEPITRDLNAVGIEEEFLDFVGSCRYHPNAVSVFLKHFYLDYPESFQEAIVHWFFISKASTPESSRLLVNEFRRMPSKLVPILEYISGYKYEVGLALGETAVESVLPELIDLLKDPKNGWDREGLIFAVARFRKLHPEAMAVLKEFAKDKENSLGKAARRALRGQGLFPNSKI